MKFPKHRSNCYVVLRSSDQSAAVCGVFPTYEGAEAFCGACQQEWEDKKLPPEVAFDVVLSTYYDA